MDSDIFKLFMLIQNLYKHHIVLQNYYKDIKDLQLNKMDIILAFGTRKRKEGQTTFFKTL
jgi:protein-tyrosine-phosphatase